MNAQTGCDTDAAMALGIASTAMPFARSPEAEAERWLRILLVHGESGIALRALGVSEAPLEASRQDADGERGEAVRGDGRDIVAAVSEAAVGVALERGTRTIGTRDVLVGAMRVYGADFDRVLQVHGTGRDEVLQWFGTPPPAVSPEPHTLD